MTVGCKLHYTLKRECIQRVNCMFSASTEKFPYSTLVKELEGKFFLNRNFQVVFILSGWSPCPVVEHTKIIFFSKINLSMG